MAWKDRRCQMTRWIVTDATLSADARKYGSLRWFALNVRGLHADNGEPFAWSIRVADAADGFDFTLAEMDRETRDAFARHGVSL